MQRRSVNRWGLFSIILSSICICLADDYANLLTLRNFTGNHFPKEFMTYLDQLQSMKLKKDSLNDRVAKHYQKKVSYHQQQKQNLYFGHY